MSTDLNNLPDAKLLPILDYIHKTYLTVATERGSGATAKAQDLIAETEKRKNKRDELINYLRGLTPFQRHIYDSGRELYKINAEVTDAIFRNRAEDMSKGYFRILALLLKLKLWCHIDHPIEAYDRELTFTKEEEAFVDRSKGIDLPLDTSESTPEPIVTLRMADVDKRELYDKETLIDADYDEPLRVLARDLIVAKYGVERLSDFSGTKKPLPPNQRINKIRVQEEVPDIIYFNGPTQFFKRKFMQLRASTYRPLDIERKETGGYKEKRIKYNQDENGNLVETDRGFISCTMHYLTPYTIWQKVVEDVKMLENTLTMGAKKINKDYFFNLFFHIQTMIADEDTSPSEAAAANVAPVAKMERFEPSKATNPAQFRDRISTEEAATLIFELSKCDQYVFGGHLDLDLYLDGIGIRKKPNVMMIDGEGLACFDYINNVIIVPRLCPVKVTPIDQIVSSFADFRFSLWTDSPKDIFDKQGVGFAIVGKKVSANKQLWQIFPNHASVLIKQRAFRDYYRRHVLSFLYNEGVRKIAGIELQLMNRITDQKLNQYFNAYVPLAVPKGDSVQIAAQAASAEPENGAAPVVPVAPAAPPAPAAAPPRPAAATPRPAAPAPPAAPAAPPSKPAAPAAPPQAAPAAPAPPKPAAAPGTIDCPNCGKSLPAASMFCLFCGSKIEKINKCKGCGAELPAGSMFCNACGAKQ